MLSRPARLWRVLPASPTSCSLWRCNGPQYNFSISPRPISTSTQSAVIIPHDVQNTTVKDVIEQIHPLDSPPCDRLAVFLFTPSFAQWATRSDTFLQSAIDRLYKNQAYCTIAALAAVVDKLPVPCSIPAPQDQHGLEGFEGVSYSFLANTGQRIEAPESRISENGSLSFHHKAQPAVTGELLEDDYARSNIIRVPLANTVFQTGRPVTLFSSSWSKDKPSDTPSCKTWTQLSNHTLEIRNQSDDSTTQTVSSMSIPLIPLTFPRKIEAGMGNIVRRIIGSDQKSMTASTELENVVPRYFKARGQSPQAISVWALVTPETIVDSVSRITASVLNGEASEGWEFSNEAWATLWKTGKPIPENLVDSAIAKGARLHRVLSGGGGWGKKAGLLALDPDISYDESFSSPAVEDNTDRFSAMDTWGVVHEFVRPGEFVQFFTLHPDPAKFANTLSRKANWEFGTISSTMDSIPTSSSQAVSPGTSSVAIYPNYFGALTESALTIVERRTLDSEKAEAWEVVNATKIDVPHTRFCTAELIKSPTPRRRTPFVMQRRSYSSDATPESPKGQRMEDWERGHELKKTLAHSIPELTEEPKERLELPKEFKELPVLSDRHREPRVRWRWKHVRDNRIRKIAYYPNSLKSTMFDMYKEARQRIHELRELRMLKRQANIKHYRRSDVKRSFKLRMIAIERIRELRRRIKIIEAEETEYEHIRLGLNEPRYTTFESQKLSGNDPAKELIHPPEEPEGSSSNDPIWELQRLSGNDPTRKSIKPAQETRKRSSTDPFQELERLSGNKPAQESEINPARGLEKKSAHEFERNAAQESERHGGNKLQPDTWVYRKKRLYTLSEEELDQKLRWLSLAHKRGYRHLETTEDRENRKQWEKQLWKRLLKAKKRAQKAKAKLAAQEAEKAARAAKLAVLEEPSLQPLQPHITGLRALLQDSEQDRARKHMPLSDEPGKPALKLKELLTHRQRRNLMKSRKREVEAKLLGEVQGWLAEAEETDKAKVQGTGNEPGWSMFGDEDPNWSLFGDEKEDKKV